MAKKKGKKKTATMSGEYDSLFLTSPMMHGAAVRRLQEMGDMLGVDRGPNDGIFGEQTEHVVTCLQERFGLKVDGICGPLTWEAITEAVDEDSQDTPGKGRLYDRRGKHPHPKWYRSHRLWNTIHGVTLHQTGCNMPRKPAGWDRLNAHFGITQEGLLILVNDPRDWIWHAQGLSRHTIGIEIEGNYCGIDGDLTTLWKGGGGPFHLNDEMMAALDHAFVIISRMFDRAGQYWKVIHAHRQSKATRIGDPGEEIWKAIGIPWLERIGGTDGGPDYRLGDGRCIPKEWDDKKTADYR